MITLSQQEQDVLYCAQLNAGHSARVLSAASGYPEHTVRRCIRRLLDRGLIHYHPFITISPLGYTQYTVFFRIGTDLQCSAERLVTYLVNSELVSWVGHLGGDYQYGISICAKHLTDVSKFLDTMTVEIGAVFFDRSIAVLASHVHFRMKYLSALTVEPLYLKYETDVPRVRVDALDHKILRAISSSQTQSATDIARLIDAKPSTVEGRLIGLREKKILLGQTYSANTHMFGMHMYLLLLHFKGVVPKVRSDLFNFTLVHQNVNFLIEYVGSWDYEVGVEVEDGRDVSRITDELYRRYPTSLNTIRVLQVFEYPKVQKYPFRSADRVVDTEF